MANRVRMIAVAILAAVFLAGCQVSDYSTAKHLAPVPGALKRKMALLDMEERAPRGPERRDRGIERLGLDHPRSPRREQVGDAPAGVPAGIARGNQRRDAAGPGARLGHGLGPGGGDPAG